MAPRGLPGTAARERRPLRGFVREHLTSHDLPLLTDDATLVASELVTNAILHAGTPFPVTITASPDTVVLTRTARQRARSAWTPKLMTRQGVGSPSWTWSAVTGGGPGPRRRQVRVGRLRREVALPVRLQGRRTTSQPAAPAGRRRQHRGARRARPRLDRRRRPVHRPGPRRWDPGRARGGRRHPEEAAQVEGSSAAPYFATRLRSTRHTTGQQAALPYSPGPDLDAAQPSGP